MVGHPRGRERQATGSPSTRTGPDRPRSRRRGRRAYWPGAAASTAPATRRRRPSRKLGASRTRRRPHRPGGRQRRGGQQEAAELQRRHRERRTADQGEQAVALVVEVEEVRAAVAGRRVPVDDARGRHRAHPPAGEPQPPRRVEILVVQEELGRKAAHRAQRAHPQQRGASREAEHVERFRTAGSSAAGATVGPVAGQDVGDRGAGIEIDAVPVPVEPCAEVVDHLRVIGQDHQRGPRRRLVVAVRRAQQRRQPVGVGHRVVVQQRAEPRADQRQGGRDAAREAGVHR